MFIVDTKAGDQTGQPSNRAETLKGKDGTLQDSTSPSGGGSVKFSFKSTRQQPEARLRYAEKYVREHANVKDTHLRNDVFDTAVDSLSEDFAADPRVENFRKEYSATADKAKGYIVFTNKFGDMLKEDGKFHDFQDAVGGTALLLNQIGVLANIVLGVTQTCFRLLAGGLEGKLY